MPGRPPHQANLRAAIVNCCARRGDSDAQRKALMAEVSKIAPDDRAWFIQYFDGQHQTAGTYPTGDRHGNNERVA